jgi:ABC-type amino acid transport system permease subunit
VTLPDSPGLDPGGIRFDRRAQFVARTFLSFDTFTMVALCYLILTLLFTRVFTAIEHRTAVEKH